MREGEDEGAEEEQLLARAPEIFSRLLRSSHCLLPQGPQPVGCSSYVRHIDSCITQLTAQGPCRTCNENQEEDATLIREGTRLTSAIPAV